jgi:hypothetical protein
VCQGRLGLPERFARFSNLFQPRTLNPLINNALLQARRISMAQITAAAVQELQKTGLPMMEC